MKGPGGREIAVLPFRGRLQVSGEGYRWGSRCAGTDAISPRETPDPGDHAAAPCGRVPECRSGDAGETGSPGARPSARGSRPRGRRPAAGRPHSNVERACPRASDLHDVVHADLCIRVPGCRPAALLRRSARHHGHLSVARLRNRAMSWSVRDVANVPAYDSRHHDSSTQGFERVAMPGAPRPFVNQPFFSQSRNLHPATPRRAPMDASKKRIA